jgi:hypothetical protein
MGNTLPGSTVSAPAISFGRRREKGFGVSLSFFFPCLSLHLAAFSRAFGFHFEFTLVFLRRVIEFHRPLGLSTCAVSNARRRHNQRLIIHPYPVHLVVLASFVFCFVAPHAFMWLLAISLDSWLEWGWRTYTLAPNRKLGLSTSPPPPSSLQAICHIGRCLVIVGLLPAHGNKNGGSRIRGRNRWNKTISPLRFCEGLIREWWGEGRPQRERQEQHPRQRQQRQEQRQQRQEQRRGGTERTARLPDDGQSGKNGRGRAYLPKRKFRFLAQ